MGVLDVLRAALLGYLRLLAAVSGWLIARVDDGVTVAGTRIHGRFPLEIVFDCAALDIQALYAVAVLLFSAPWRRKWIGLGTGLGIITAANVARIVALYFIGANAPGAFHTMHHEVFQLALLVLTCALFVAWAFRRPPRPARPPEMSGAGA
jgi:exosortase/archaeosortase family protein